MNKRKSIIIVISFVVAGIIAGFLYWRFVGCISDSCPLKSNVYLMILQGGLLGFLIADFINSKKSVK
ncbi:MAG: hypothetical protein ACP5P3_05960 [Ignavibacteria bacterium]